jgi:hypothetical protein
MSVLGTGLSWDYGTVLEQDFPGIMWLSWEQDFPGIMGQSWEQSFPGITGHSWKQDFPGTALSYCSCSFPVFKIVGVLFNSMKKVWGLSQEILRCFQDFSWFPGIVSGFPVHFLNGMSKQHKNKQHKIDFFL